MTHAPKWRALVAYHAGALSEDGRRRVDMHLGTCSVCVDALARVRAYGEVQGEVRAQPVPEVGDLFGAQAGAFAMLIDEVRAAEAPTPDWDAVEAGIFAALATEPGTDAEEDGHAPKWRALLAYQEEALSPAGRARVERHLEECDICAEALASMHAYDEVAETVRGSEPQVDFNVLELPIRRAARARRRERWVAGGVMVLAAAAAVALMVRPSGERAVVVPGESVALRPAPPPEAPMLEATVVAVGGDVRVDEQSVEVGAGLSESDTLQLTNGAVHVRLASRTGFALDGDAELGLARMREDGVALALRRGRVQSQVRTGTRYAIEAGDYVIHVRGTRFEVRRDGERVAVTVDEGVVEVRRDDAVVALLPAPATWSSHAEFEGAPLGSVATARALAESAIDWPVLRLAPTDRFVRWEVDGTTFDAAGGLAMRAPAGPLTLVAYDAEGQRHTADIEIADEGTLVEDHALAPEQAGPVPGYIRPEDIQAVVRPSVQRMQRCYERTLRQMNPELEGEYALRVTVRRDGTVRRVRVVTTADAPPPFVGCLRAIASRWQFPPPEGGPTATFNLPLSFGVSSH